MQIETKYIDLLKSNNGKILEYNTIIKSIINKREIINNNCLDFLKNTFKDIDLMFFKLTKSLCSNSNSKYVDHGTPFKVINVCYDISKIRDCNVALISIDNTNFVLYFTPPNINEFNFSGENVIEYVTDIIKIDFATHTDVSLYFNEYKKKINEYRN
jgi:hypothetical protein